MIKMVHTFIFTVTSVQDMNVHFKIYSHLEMQVYNRAYCKRVKFFLILVLSKVSLNETNKLADAHLIIFINQSFNLLSLKY